MIVVLLHRHQLHRNLPTDRHMRRKSAYLEGFLMVEQNHLAGQEWVDIVNEDNEVIAQCSREQMRAERLRHRATYIVSSRRHG